MSSYSQIKPAHYKKFKLVLHQSDSNLLLPIVMVLGKHIMCALNVLMQTFRISGSQRAFLGTTEPVVLRHFALALRTVPLKEYDFLAHKLRAKNKFYFYGHLLLILVLLLYYYYFLSLKKFLPSCDDSFFLGSVNQLLFIIKVR